MGTITTLNGDWTKSDIMGQDFLKKQTSNRQLSIRGRKAIQTADDYTPAVSANWATVPTKQDEALDMLAAAASVTPVKSVIVKMDASVDTISAGGVFTSSITLPSNAVVMKCIVDELSAISGNSVVTMEVKAGATAISSSYTVGTPGVTDKTSLAKGSGAVTLNFFTAVPAGAKPTAGSVNVIIQYTVSAQP